uniref:Uncharacterized protein n=1 Tax=Octopus bimaculoides TaxID=37653 RepID=A0A0L8I558_OCTBM
MYPRLRTRTHIDLRPVLLQTHLQPVNTKTHNQFPTTVHHLFFTFTWNWYCFFFFIIFACSNSGCRKENTSDTKLFSKRKNISAEILRFHYRHIRSTNIFLQFRF